MFSRECGDCNLCCKWLYLNVDNELVRPGRPCKYVGKSCTIHEKRPNVCRNYFCAYIQGVLPEWMKPSHCGIIVSVKKWGPNKEYQYLQAAETDKTMSVEVLSWLVQFCSEQNVGLSYQLNGSPNYVGSKEFLEYFESNKLLEGDVGELINS